jgi:hypothetical protein
MTTSSELDGQRFVAEPAEPQFKFTEAFSLVRNRIAARDRLHWSRFCEAAARASAAG